MLPLVPTCHCNSAEPRTCTQKLFPTCLSEIKDFAILHRGLAQLQPGHLEVLFRGETTSNCWSVSLVASLSHGPYIEVRRRSMSYGPSRTQQKHTEMLHSLVREKEGNSRSDNPQHSSNVEPDYTDVLQGFANPILLLEPAYFVYRA